MELEEIAQERWREEWKVTWFPPDGDKEATGDESRVRRIARREAEWHPIIEKRDIQVGPWDIVEGLGL